MTPNANAPNRLIVEGRDDKWAVISLARRHGWDWDKPRDFYPYVHEAGCAEEVLESLIPSLQTYSRLGIVLDADIQPANRWVAVRQRLLRAGYQAPSSPDVSGTILDINGKRLGIWLMPDNSSPGKLEDFLAKLIPVADRCWPLAEESTKRARDCGAGFSDPDFIKARIHAWLAWQKEPGHPFGTAITAATFLHETALSKMFFSWLEKVYT